MPAAHRQPLRVLAALVAVLALLLAGAPRARADGDPASDVLLGEAVYYPYSPAVSAATTKTLNGTMAAAVKAHFNLKVALIAEPVDLGVIPALFGKPQKYADFLDQEISFTSTRQPVLVVMKAGYGVAGVSAAVRSAAASLPLPASGTSEGLAQAAIAAVHKLAAADGHPLGPVSAAGAPPSSGSDVNLPLLIVLIGCALLAAGGLVALRQRVAGRAHQQ